MSSGLAFCRNAECFTEAVVQLPLAALPGAGKTVGGIGHSMALQHS